MEHTRSFETSDGDAVVSLVNLTEIDEWTVYIGRENAYYNLPESEFSNPYTTTEYERETAVRLYELWFYRQLYSDEAFFESFVALQGEQLACWCLPEACHGEVIANALVAYAEGSLSEHIDERMEKLSVVLFGFAEEKKATREVIDKRA